VCNTKPVGILLLQTYFPAVCPKPNLPLHTHVEAVLDVRIAAAYRMEKLLKECVSAAQGFLYDIAEGSCTDAFLWRKLEADLKAGQPLQGSNSKNKVTSRPLRLFLVSSLKNNLCTLLIYSGRGSWPRRFQPPQRSVLPVSVPWAPGMLGQATETGD
jgi:hypothetical protein